MRFDSEQYELFFNQVFNNKQFPVLIYEFDTLFIIDVSHIGIGKTTKD
jgi:hypothetical protein